MSGSALKWNGNRPRYGTAFGTVAVALLLAGCTSTSPSPPRDLAAIFTPTAQDEANAPTVESQLEQASETSLAPKQTESAKPGNDTASVIAALSPAEEKKPSEAAVASATQQEPKKPATPAVKKPVAIARAETEQLQRPAKKDNSLLGLFRANQQKADSSNGGARAKPSSQSQSAARTSQRANNGSLPGVRSKNLFGVTPAKNVRRPKKDVKDKNIIVASAASRAVRGNHGLLLQRPNVKVGCFPRRLLSILRKVERRFGRKVIVTSGFRSKAHNRRIRGARNSTHTRCLAADIQVKGVSKWQMARYLRSLPGRGGVGTYCHTKSVHIDIAKKRSWNYCSRRRGKKRRS
ncbi:MAG: D-Ala-D-Ala carboxypeptidase family metallohydrolase [Pseudomonadota bacterium]